MPTTQDTIDEADETVPLTIGGVTGTGTIVDDDAAPKITSVDTAGYPTVRATVVTPKPVGAAPALTEGGRPMVFFDGPGGTQVPQSVIDAARFGPNAGNPILGAADYKLVHHAANGRSVYSSPRKNHEPASRAMRLVCLPIQPSPALRASARSSTGAESTKTR